MGDVLPHETENTVYRYLTAISKLRLGIGPSYIDSYPLFIHSSLFIYLSDAELERFDLRFDVTIKIFQVVRWCNRDGVYFMKMPPPPGLAPRWSTYGMFFRRSRTTTSQHASTTTSVHPYKCLWLPLVSPCTSATAMRTAASSAVVRADSIVLPLQDVS